MRGSLGALAVGLFVLAALWVPINHRPVPRGYFETTWFEGFQPRGLMGTLAAALGLTPRQFVELNLIGEVIFLFLLLLALVRAGEGVAAAPTRRWLGLVLLAILLSFHQVLFFGHFLSGFVDIHSAALTLGAVHLLAFGTGPPRPLALGLAAALSGLSLLNHERSVLDAAVLATWLWLRFGPRVAAGYFAPVAACLALFFVPFSSQAQMGMSLPQYWANLEKVTLYVRQESGSLVGIFYGGGFAWLLWAYGASRLLRRQESGGSRLKAAAFVLVSLAACLAPLLVAHDTSRLVGLMWLSTLLMLTTLRLPRQLARSRGLFRFVTVLAVLQLALPPLFIYKFDAVPLNCYAQNMVRTVCAQEPGEEWTALGGWLRLYEDGGHRPWYQKRCLIPRLFRQ